MEARSTSGADRLVADLRRLCSHPTVTGNRRALEDGLHAVVSVLQAASLHCRLYATDGIPIVLGRYDAGSARSVLLYGRFDVPEPGPRRAWRGDPFQPAVRAERLWARGAVVKAELVARAHALRRLIAEDALSANVLFVVEGESHAGSPHLDAVATATRSASMALWSGGGFGTNGPLLYTGLKGLLQVEIEAAGAALALSPTYAVSAPNPLWNLVSALSGVKSTWEEVTIDGFYDDVAAPSDAALARVRELDVGERARRDVWKLDRFAANLQGSLLARAESFSPGCHLSKIEVAGNSPGIPSQASAILQFQLVPDQHPDTIFKLLVEHLAAQGVAHVTARRLPGAFAPHTGFHERLVARAVEAGKAAGQPLHVGDLAPFPGPAGLLLRTGIPLLSCGLERPDSALYGPDESVSLLDLVAHSELVEALLRDLPAI